jgi:ABC-type uncharacterized transport system permease subunit
MVDYRINKHDGQSGTRDSRWVWRTLAITGIVAGLYGLYEVSQGLTRSRDLNSVIAESFRNS